MRNQPDRCFNPRNLAHNRDTLMRKLLVIIFLCCLPLAFAEIGDPGSTSALQPVWIQMLMLFAMLLVGITSRQISRIR